jgi:hypothetical protein
MAIDSIEYNELAALSESRLGSKNFVDDSNYSNLFGSQKQKKSVASAQDRQAAAELQLKYLVTSKDNCDTIEKKLFAVQNELELSLKNNRGDRYVNPLRSIESNLKTKLTDLDCAKKRLAQEKSEEEKRNIDILSSITNAPPPMIGDLDGDKSSKMNKYIIYGVGGVILLFGIILLVKKK